MSNCARELQLPPAKPFDPTTFLERGVTVPFTTPALGGARARPGWGGEVELIVRNPYGGRGVYIMPWRNICDLFRPTVHDRCLNYQILAAPSITPRTIRVISQRIAAGGLAGDEARLAAQASEQRELQNRVTLNFELLERLIEQAEKYDRNAGRVVASLAHDKRRRAMRAIASIAPRLGIPGDEVSGILETLAVCLECVGIERQGVPSRIDIIVASLNQTIHEVSLWACQQLNDELRALGQIVSESAALTSSIAAVIIPNVLELTSDIFNFLQRWIHNRRPIMELAMRPEWLLDGWEQICLLWRTAGDHASHAVVIAEMAHLLPVIPREVFDWIEPGIEREKLISRHRVVPLNTDWRTGAQVFELVARNEHLRSLELSFGT